MAPVTVSPRHENTTKNSAKHRPAKPHETTAKAYASATANNGAKPPAKAQTYMPRPTTARNHLQRRKRTATTNNGTKPPVKRRKRTAMTYQDTIGRNNNTQGENLYIIYNNGTVERTRIPWYCNPGLSEDTGHGALRRAHAETLLRPRTAPAKTHNHGLRHGDSQAPHKEEERRHEA